MRRSALRLPLHLFVFGLMVLTGAGCGGSSGPGPSNTVTPVVVAFGDSLTAGPALSRDQTYPAHLERLARAAGYPHRFVNAGVNGDTTADGVRRLDSALVADATVLILALGANDGLQGVPVEEIRRNLSTIIERTRMRGLRILLCGMETLPFRGLQYALDFRRVFPDLAAQYDLPFMPFLLADVAGIPEMNLPDLLHPNAAGARKIAENMWPYLEPLLR